MPFLTPEKPASANNVRLINDQRRRVHSRVKQFFKLLKVARLSEPRNRQASAGTAELLWSWVGRSIDDGACSGGHQFGTTEFGQERRDFLFVQLVVLVGIGQFVGGVHV